MTTFSSGTEKDSALATKLESLVKALSESLDSKISNLSATADAKLDNLEQRVQERWETFEDKRTEKIMHPDDTEAVTCNAEFRIRRAVQQDEDERWKKRMANEDKITTNAIETLQSGLRIMSAKMADEVACVKNRHQGSAASTVSGSTRSGGNMGHFTFR